MRWVRRGGFAAMLVIGWVFIAWQNRFYISAPVVFVCLGYLAVVATLYNLWRTGVTAVASSDDEDDSTWAKPAGALGELEREKRTLLKAIKEAEFDHQMGKLSKRDADEMVRAYRARAIEVIKELDKLGSGSSGSTREQILREVRARLELDVKASNKAKAKADARSNAKEGGKASRKAKPAAAPSPATGPDASAASADAPDVSPPDVEEEAKDAAASVAAAAAPSAGAAAGPRAVPVAVPATPDPPTDGDDDAMNADSTTTVEPRRNDSVKEATP